MTITMTWQILCSMYSLCMAQTLEMGCGSHHIFFSTAKVWSDAMASVSLLDAVIYSRLLLGMTGV